MFPFISPCRHGGPGLLLCLVLALVTSCSDPQSPPPSGGDATFMGLYEEGGALEFRIETAEGEPSTLRLVATDLNFDAPAGRLHAQVAILNAGNEALPGPDVVQIDEIHPEWIVPVNALPMRCPPGPRCPGTWVFQHQGTYGEDGLLSPGETSSPIEWIFADSTGESFSFRASLRPGDATPPGVISGFVFGDVNGDGQRQASEPGLEGVNVSLVYDDSTRTTTTGADGGFEFPVDEAGLYEVVREAASDCDPTTPERLQVFIVRRPDGTLSGFSHADFGCRASGPGDDIFVIGIVFEDLNRDGRYQVGEPGLPGVLITGVVPACPTFAPIEARTDGSGRYSIRLPNCPPPYVINREPLPGFVDTSPNPVVLAVPVPVPVPLPEPELKPEFLPAPLPVPLPAPVPGPVPGPAPQPVRVPLRVVTPGDSSSVTLRADFGVARSDSGESSVEGFVFEDRNRNGLRESDEPGLAGVEVTASGIFCMTPVLGLTHTDASGYYFLSESDVHCMLPWRVAHAEIEGYCDTSRNPVEIGFDRRPDPRHYRVNFGVAPCDSLPNEGVLIVFVAWDGQGLPGRRLEIVELGQEQFTNERGFARFVLPPGDYTLHADVNDGGPPLGRDFLVTVRRGQTTRLDVLDCLPCAAIE